MASPSYRTSPGTLRRLSHGHMIYDAGGGATGEWDRFQIRRLCMQVVRRASKGARGRSSLKQVLSLVPDLGKKNIDGILRAKAGADETEYVRLLQRNKELRAAILKLGNE